MDESRWQQLIERAQRFTELAKKLKNCTFEELVEKTRDEDAEVRGTVVRYLKNLEDPRAVPIFIELMNDPSARVRGGAALALWQHSVIEARDVLIDHLKNDEYGDVRAYCILGLRAIGGAEEEIVAALDDPDWNVKESAITSLNHLGIRSAAGKILEQLNEPNYWGVRYFACCALIDFEVADERIVKTLFELREDPEACELVACFARSDVWMNACEKYGDEIPEFDDDIKQETEPDLDAILARLREKYGEDEIPYPSKDPLSDLAEKAQALIRNSQGL